ncbi:YqgE/AlgH family protein [bacterium]|nr:YqgE/AlgH family protein [bacterium]
MITENPCFLVAMPQLMDPNFVKSVVIMIHQASDGAMGLAINNAFPDLSVDRFARTQGMEYHPSFIDVPVYCGGPVQPESGWILHTNDTLEEKQKIADGLYFSVTKESLEKLLQEEGKPFKLILGYAGWDAGQLKQEMIDGSWITAPINTTHLFKTNPDEVWKNVLTDMGINPANLLIGGGVH